MPTSPRSGRPRKLSPTHHRHERTSTRYLSGTTEHGTPYVEEHRSERTTIRRYGEEASMERERRGSSPQRESRAGRRSAPYHPQPHPRASSHRGRPSSRRSSNGSSYVCDTPRGASRPSRATSARTSHTPQPREHGRRSTSRSHRPSRRSSAFTDRGEFDEYRTPARRDDGRFSVGGASRSRSRRTSMSVAQPRRASNGGCATFRVRIFEGRGLLTQSEIARGMHLSIAVHNANERGRTGVVAGSSANLRFHDEFRFTSADPSRDALVCTLVATGPNLNVSRSSTMGAGERDQRVGECVISLRHVLWQHEREVWVPMVRRPGTEEAYERGELLISIYSDDFGYDETLANDTDAFAEEVHEVLMRYGRSDLHRFDCIVGHTIPQGKPGLDRLRVRYRANHDDEMHIVYLTVRDVEDLCAADGSLGPGRSTAPITVVVGALEEEMRSQPTNYRRGQAVVRQEFRLALEDPLKDAISIIVFAAGHRVAEAQIGLTNIIAGVAKELDVQLVSSAETGDAVVCGMMHVVLRTESYTSAFSMTEEEEAQMRNRVRGFLWANLRDELHRLEYILSTVGPNKEAFMRKWARRVGAAEPTRHELLLTVQGCSPAAIAITDLDKTRSTKGPRTAPVSSTRRHYFVRISTGYSISRTDVVRAKEDGRLVFAHHEEMLNIFTPRTCAVEYILVEVRDGEERELRRVVMGVWTLPREQRVVRELHLVAAAGSCSAALSGFLVVELTAMDFGVHQPETEERAERRNRCIEELENLARDGGMDRLHRVGYVVDTTAPGNEESLIEAQAHAQGSTLMMSGPGGMDASAMIVESAPMQVRILGIREFVAAGNQAYVKAYLGPRAILRTRDKAAIAGTISYDIDDGNEVSDTLHRHECGERLELKVAQHRGFRSHVYARTSVALQALVCDHPNELWLPLFCEDGGAVAGGSRGDGDALRANHLPTTVGPSVAPLGYLGVRLESSAFVNRLPIYRGADYGEPGQPFMEALMRDVGTLLAKYAPSQLPRAHILIAECSSLSTAHDELRARLCPRPVRLTLFLHVEGLAIHDAELARQERRGGIAVYATFLEEGQEGAPRPLLAMDGGDGGAYASIRLDVCDPSAAAPQVAKSWLANDLAAPPLELRLMGVRPTRPATGADRDANPLQPQVGELGLVRLSLRALLSHKFYRLGEPFTVPIVASSSSSDDVEEAACVLGHITCRLSTAAGDVAPAGLTLGGPRAYSSAEARSIVASAHRISSYLDQASPAHLRDCHYHLYEDDVASGRWPTSLRDWANELKQLCRSSSRQQQQHHRR